MSLYGDAIRALRQVILLDERVRNHALDLARVSREVAELRERVSRIEGMLAVVAGVRPVNPSGGLPSLPEPPATSGWTRRRAPPTLAPAQAG